MTHRLPALARSQAAPALITSSHEIGHTLSSVARQLVDQKSSENRTFPQSRAVKGARRQGNLRKRRFAKDRSALSTIRDGVVIVQSTLNQRPGGADPRRYLWSAHDDARGEQCTDRSYRPDRLGRGDRPPDPAGQR